MKEIKNEKDKAEKNKQMSRKDQVCSGKVTEKRTLSEEGKETRELTQALGKAV